MSEAIIKKNGTDYPLLTMPNHYPADRTYLDGDPTKTVQDAVDKQEAMIATVQPNLTAVKAYAKDEQFVYQGLLYKFTTSCAQGGTITIGGNCELADSVTEQIDAINGWVDITSEITWHSAVAYKKAIFNPALKLIKIQVTSDDTGIGNSAPYLTLPNKYTPKTDLMMKIGNNYYTQSDVFYSFTTSIESTSVIWHNGRFIFKSSSPRTLVLNYNVAQNAYYHQGWAEFYVE